MKGQKSIGPLDQLPAVDPSAMLGHELGNVLNGLLGMAELLGESGLNPEQSQWLEAMQESGQQLLEMIQPCRFQGHGPTLDLTARPRTFDGIRLLEQILTSHVPKAQANDNQLYLVVDPGLPGAWHCDACMVRQVLDNVVGNAVKFSTNGDITIEALAGPVPAELILRVSDTGPGLQSKPRSREVDRKRRRMHSWTAGVNQASGVNDRGLGLLISQLITRSLNGKLVFSARAHGGTCVELSIPGVVFEGDEWQRPCGSLPAFVICHLDLPAKQLKCTSNALLRMGVEWTTHSIREPGHRLAVEIGEAAPVPDCQENSLYLRPSCPNGTALRPAFISMPVLETNLRAALLRIVLEWHSRDVSRDTRG